MSSPAIGAGPLAGRPGGGAEVAMPRRRRYPWSVLRRSVPRAAIFAVVFVFFALPLFLLVISAFSSNATITTFQWPSSFTFSNFSSVVASGTGFGTAVVDGFILSAGSSAIALAMGALAAYPLSRFSFRGRVGFLLTVLFVTGVPVTALIVPLYQFFQGFGWLDQMLPVTLLMAAFATPISIWLTKTFLDNIDPAIEESSWVDGTSRFGGYVRVVLPLMKTGLLVVFLLDFITGWANFYVPFVLLSSTSKLPIAVTIYQFFGSYGTVEYGKLAAFSILYSVPPAFLYLFTGGRLGGSFSTGAMKG
jgi:multiple sugar transport system permease protein